jgi:molybdate transport system substrate-binding protein
MKRLFMLFLTLAMLISIGACSSPAKPAPAANAASVPDLPSAVPTEAATVPLTATPETQTLIVFAAASLTNAFGEIGKTFEAAHPGVTVTYNFGGSQVLRTQIEQGAQADVFASANAKEMDALVTGKFVAADTSKIFLTNRLVVIMPANNPAGLATLADLAKPGLKLVLAAKEVPVGNYALQVLAKLNTTLGVGYKDNVLKNVVSYESDVKQVVAKIKLGEADAGIVYSSDMVAAPDLQKIEIPAENNVIAKYPLAAINQAKNPDLAQAFIAYVLSADGQTILHKWGFLPVK